MKKSVCCLSTLLLLAQPVRTQILFKQPLSPRIANYRIQALLDAGKKQIRGREILSWRNTSPNPVREIPFHLYMNAFKNNRSTLFRENNGRTGVLGREKAWGWIEIRSIKLPDGFDLKPGLVFIQPDDGNPDDRTVCRVTLPRAVEPGGELRLEIDFVTQLPRLYMRTGYDKDFFMVAQWFPKIGVLTDGRWNCHQFHFDSEFFADFGVYDVRLTLPKRFIVGTVGTVLDTAETDSGKTLTCRAEDVHDFAWAAWPEFQTKKEKIGGVEITLLYGSSHRSSVARYLDALKKTMVYFSERIGSYPYPGLTIIDPPARALRAGGMEYPTLFTGLTHSLMPRGIRMTESVIVHEFGHNYWQGMVASNEFEEAWLDEGVNQYFEGKIMDAGYGKETSSLNLFGIRIGQLAELRRGYIADPGKDRILRNSWTYIGGGYGTMTYSKPALMLLTLENWIGQDRMDRILKTYFERWKFKHPRSRDFLRVVGEVAGPDPARFLDQVLNGSAELDYEIASARTEKIADSEGIFEREGNASAHPDSGSAVGRKSGKKGSKSSDSPKAYRSIVDVHRRGTLTVPVDVLVVFDKKDTVREKWDGMDLWKRFEYVKPNALMHAEVDPDRKWLLDSKFANNSKTVEPRNKPARLLFVRFLLWAESLLHGFAFLS